MAGWGPKFKDQPKMAFVPVIYHIGPYENACKSEKVEKVPPPTYKLHILGFRVRDWPCVVQHRHRWNKEKQIVQHFPFYRLLTG